MATRSEEATLATWSRQSSGVAEEFAPKDSLIKELKAQFNVEKLEYQQNLEEKDKIIDQLKLNQVTNSQELTVVIQPQAH